ncbi:MAG: hypothetical protein Q4F75_03690, partial [Pseudomonadota bacterium]|nr:hypothetical protein [Pseudomonadota bacterium]
MKFDKIFIYTFLALLFSGLGAKNISAQQFNEGSAIYTREELKNRNIHVPEKLGFEDIGNGKFKFKAENGAQEQALNDFMRTGNADY